MDQNGHEWVDVAVVRRWVEEDAARGPSGLRQFSGTVRALTDLGRVDRDLAVRLENNLWQRSDATPPTRPTQTTVGAVAGPRLLRSVPIGSTLGPGWPEHLYAVALDIFDDHLELAIFGDARKPGLSDHRDPQRIRQLYCDARALVLSDDVGTVYRESTDLGATLDERWLQTTFYIAPAPPFSATRLRISDTSGRVCFEVNLDEPSPSTVAVRRQVDPEAAVRNQLLAELAVIDSSAFPRGPAERFGAIRRATEDALVVGRRLVEVRLLPAGHPMLVRLERAVGSQDNDLGNLLDVSITDPVVDPPRPPKLLRVVPLAALLGPLGGRRVVVRWLAIFSDRAVLLVTDHHGDPMGRGSSDLRWRISDGSRWRKGAHSWTHWCGASWTTSPMTVWCRPPRGARHLTISVDAQGQEASVTIRLGDYPKLGH